MSLSIEAPPVLDTDVECTPPELWQPVLDALGIRKFDTDPCTNPHASVPAIFKAMLPIDGLTLRWCGNVWCNPPYSKPAPWVKRCANHDGCAVALLSGDYSTAMWDEVIWPSADLVVLLKKRPRFHNPATPDRKTTAKRPGALVFWNLQKPLKREHLEPLGKLVWRGL
jgi:hypothetical protein